MMHPTNRVRRTSGNAVENIEAIQGENGHDHRDYDFGCAFPDTGGGFAVIFAHDLIQIGLRVAAVFGGGRGVDRGSRLCIFFKDAQGERPPLFGDSLL